MELREAQERLRLIYRFIMLQAGRHMLQGTNAILNVADTRSTLPFKEDYRHFSPFKLFALESSVLPPQQNYRALTTYAIPLLLSSV